MIWSISQHYGNVLNRNLLTSTAKEGMQSFRPKLLPLLKRYQAESFLAILRNNYRHWPLGDQVARALNQVLIQVP